MKVTVILTDREPEQKLEAFVIQLPCLCGKCKTVARRYMWDESELGPMIQEHLSFE